MSKTFMYKALYQCECFTEAYVFESEDGELDGAWDRTTFDDEPPQKVLDALEIEFDPTEGESFTIDLLEDVQLI